jgi:hypothetical protein
MEKKRDVALMPNRCKPAVEVSTQWAVTMEPEHRHEDLFNPSYWAHVGVQLQVGNILEVRSDMGSFYGRFIVTEATRNAAKIHELEWHDLDSSEVELVDDSKYSWKWGGPVKKHLVVRDSDGAVIHEQMPSKAAVMEWIAKERKSAA